MSKTKSNPNSAAKALPAYRIYCVTKNGEGKSTWQEIGAAWLHRRDGKGLNLQFNALPLPNGEIVLREPKPKKEG